jgi:hypothetical protein
VLKISDDYMIENKNLVFAHCGSSSLDRKSTAYAAQKALMEGINFNNLEMPQLFAFGLKDGK